MIYQFTDHRLDTDRCRLTRGHREVPLRPKPFDLLLLLLERAGKIVSKDELHSRLWPDVTVTDSSLTQCVAELRQSLGADGAALIRTVSRRGYVFDAPVRQEAAPVTGDLRRHGWLGSGLALGLALLSAAAVGALLYHGAQRLRPIHDVALLSTDTDTLGRPIVFPEGPAHIAAGITVIPSGGTSMWHSHDAPLFAYVLSGEVVVEYETGRERRLVAGEAMVEPVDVAHRATNNGLSPARIVYVLMGAEGMQLRQPEPDPLMGVVADPGRRVARIAPALLTPVVSSAP